MIATTYESPYRTERQARYHLRRALVRRLQEASRGVTRRDRVALQRRFVGEWQLWTARNEFPSLGEAFHRCGLGPQPAEIRPIRESVKSLAPEAEPKQTREFLPSGTRIRQGDLFKTGLVGAY